jgi:hypothetical protein
MSWPPDELWRTIAALWPSMARLAPVAFVKLSLHAADAIMAVAFLTRVTRVVASFLWITYRFHRHPCRRLWRSKSLTFFICVGVSIFWGRA